MKGKSMMSDKVLEKMFRKNNEKKMNYHLKILNYFWENWDELAEKQERAIDGEIDNFHSYPEAYIPTKIYRLMWPDTVDYLNVMLWDMCEYRKTVKGKKRLTRTKFVKKYLEYMGLN